MSLVVWLPLTKDLRQQGLSSMTVENHNATLNTAGKLGSCYYFNGSQQWLQLSNNLGNFYNNDWSVACWLKPTDSTRSIILSEYSGTGASNVAIELTTARIVRLYWNGSPDISFSTAEALPLNEWTHLVMAKQGRIVKLYFNGELKQTYTNSSDFSTRISACQPRIGDDYRGNSGNSVSYQGYMNDFRMYDHCLSPMEVKELAKGLVLHYPLNRNGWGQENLYTTSQDFSGSWNSKSNWTTSEETYQNFIVKQKSTIWGGLSQNIPCSNGDIFTISFYAKVDTGGRICSIHRSSLGNVTTGLTILGGNFISGTDWINATDDGTQWKRYWATVRIDSSDITYLQWRIENSVADKTLYICGMKMERGSIATPWCPNSSDALATTMGLNSTTEYDCSGFCNNGTWHGVHTNTSDTPKYAVSTTATGSSTTYLEGPVLPEEAKTVALWIKNTSKSSNGAIFNDKTTGLQIGLLNSLLYMNSKASTAGFTTTHWVNGEWNHVVAINNNGTRSLYVNGQPETQSGASNYYIHNADNCWLWNRSYNNSYPFTGSLCDLRVYATALSADDVKSLYQNCATIDPDGTIRGQIRS